MLDELDKIGQDFRGDPASVLLEILDPEQNAQFMDHYVDIPFDLSSVMFIATANMVEKIPAPLLDRLEIIHFTGYTEKEKQAIAKNHIIPRQLRNHGLSHDRLAFSDSAITRIIAIIPRRRVFAILSANSPMCAASLPGFASITRTTPAW